jgi:hypothetical protein
MAPKASALLAIPMPVLKCTMPLYLCRYRKICSKYRDGPTVLLLARKEGHILGGEKVPREWNRGEVKRFVESAVGPTFAAKFNLTGSQMMMLDQNAMQRRCGGGWSVPEVDLVVTKGGNYDGAEANGSNAASAVDGGDSGADVAEESAEQTETKRVEAEAAAAGEAAGLKLWEEWATKLRHAKAARSRLGSSGSISVGSGGGAAAGRQDVPVSITVLTPELAPASAVKAAASDDPATAE